MWTSIIAASVVLVTPVLGQAASYAPVVVDCPSFSLINQTGSPLDGTQVLSYGEDRYLTTRRTRVLNDLYRTYLGNDTGYNASEIIAEQPKLGIAVSGGGLRASLYGAGTISALDQRNSTSLGPLLQLADYLTGLSGGSWAVSSLAMNDLPNPYDLVLGTNGESGWLLDLDILTPAGLLGLGDNSDYIDNIQADVREKTAVGAPASLVDLWGRALAMHFYNGTTRANFYEANASHSAGLLWSSIKLTQNFQSFAMPLPIVVATSRVSQEAQMMGMSSTVIPLNNTQFEFTPFTLGSYDPTLRAQVPLEYAGTYLNAGQPINGSACVNAFENAGFVIGTSAALFNAVQSGFSSDTIVDLINKLVGDIADVNPPSSSIPLVANWPNSWRGFAPEGGKAFESAQNDILQLTDGGENGENVPIGPLLVKARSVDIVLAIDASADTNYNWPNGTSLLATANRAANYVDGFTDFPPIPATADDFVSQGLNVRPTFFGCNATNMGNVSESGAYPIVVYMPSAPVAGASYSQNTSTFKLSYDIEDVVSFLDVSHANALKGFPNQGQERDDNFALCLKCAVVDRARTRAMVNRTEACETCFTRYCWSDGIADALTNATASNGGNGTVSPPVSGAAHIVATLASLVVAGVLAIVLA